VKGRFRRWALISAAVMAIPAFILGVLVLTPSSAPDVKPAPTSAPVVSKPAAPGATAARPVSPATSPTAVE
jgi:hypothetical protein